QATSEFEARDFRESTTDDEPDDFLGENIEQWRRTTGRTNLTEAPPAPTASRTLRRRTRPNFKPIGVRRSTTPGMQVEWSPRDRAVYVGWNGFVEDSALRSAFASGLDLMVKHRGDAWLIDMNAASVLNTDDAEWFTNWLGAACKRGANRFAIVRPENAIPRMQIRRLRDAAYATTAGVPGQKRMDISFFDSIDEAEAWLHGASSVP